MQIPSILIDKLLMEKYPDIRLGILLTKVKVANSTNTLLQLIKDGTESRSSELAIENIATIPALKHTRQAYKALGKDPSRYRPSAEALLRRVVSGKPLYQVNNVVDALNLVSLQTGFSIGGYDFEKIYGGIKLGKGAKKEPYIAIGRGTLNIEGLPVLRDDISAFGSPTSDSTRTMITEKTTVFIAVIFDFGKNETLEEALSGLELLLVKYAEGEVVGKICMVPSKSGGI